MQKRNKKILAIIGSATPNSSNQKFVEKIIEKVDHFDITMYNSLSELPHFNTELTEHNVPEKIKNIRELIEHSDGILFSTPEYIFSIPSGLKNLLEWCVSTMIFTNKPISVLTASSSGIKGHEELHLILETLGAIIRPENSILIKGIKGKFDQYGNIDKELLQHVLSIMNNFNKTIEDFRHSS
ncbi:NAD(P)H-dependent oxidoreductase [Sphingobacterium sp. SRCM116780]|uniref:NADPH-dependent FMN reductase n=1 Tax=Sphingobacterium sp. SRCM116780 TaxID=2907623 RepID=UPI001F2D42E6|nr:NAD(P)H-dependent oxidoreductase [Sphingobacterium sp. SRCM116780]UIR57282.1 NAD(P)H-dependent oxidoreductase [Sphingobacterium sp. SRCM116780]